MSLLQLISYWLLIRGSKVRKKSYFITSGILMGLCLYTYVASWIAFSIALVFMLFGAIWERDGWRARLQEGACFVFACMIVFAPLGGYYLRHPADLIVRTSELSSANSIADTQSLSPLLESAGKYALMFNFRGDRNPRHGSPMNRRWILSRRFFLSWASLIKRDCGDAQSPVCAFVVLLGLQGGLLSEPSRLRHTRIEHL